MATKLGFQIESSLASKHLTDAEYIKGGYIVVSTIADRDALPKAADDPDGLGHGVIIPGSLVYVSATGKSYRWTGTTWDENTDSTKLDKVSTITDNKQAYTKEADGSQSMTNVSSSIINNAIVQRDSNGQVVVPETPTADSQAASKKYVDNSISNTIAGLDGSADSAVVSGSAKTEKITLHTISEDDGVISQGNAISKAITYTDNAIDSKLDDKVDKRTSGNEVYTHSGTTQGGIAYTTAATADTIVERTTNGNIILPTKDKMTEDNYAVSKDYVDTYGGKIDTISINDEPLDIENKDVNIAVEGNYDATTNKIATESTVSDAIADLDGSANAGTVSGSGKTQKIAINGITEDAGVISTGSAIANATTYTDAAVDAILADYVLKTTKVNNKALSSDITIYGTDISASSTDSTKIIDSNGKIPTSILPESVTSGMEYKGTFNAATASGSISGLETGWFYICSTAGTKNPDGTTGPTDGYAVGDWAVYNGATDGWAKIDNDGKVQSVNGKTGTVTLDKTDVGLSNVANTTITVDANDGVSSSDGTTTTTYKYTHPAGSEASKQKGFYKFSTDSTSHISEAEAVTLSDLTGLGAVASSRKVEGKGILSGGGALTSDIEITHNKPANSPAQNSSKVYKTTVDEYGHVLTTAKAAPADLGISATTTSVTVGSTTFNKLEMAGSGSATTAAHSDHTHSISIANGGSDATALSANTTYTLTAGGQSVVFTTPADNPGVTKVQTGVGLTGGDITSTGTIKAKLRDETLNTNDSTKSASSSGGLYAVEADKSGYLAVRVPWTDNNDNYYPTSFTWTNGTTSGPTGTLSGTGMSDVSFGAIPAANETHSGIVTTDGQTFKGEKVFCDGNIVINSGHNALVVSSDSDHSNTGSEISSAYYGDYIVVDDDTTRSAWTLCLPVLQNGESATLAIRGETNLTDDILDGTYHKYSPYTAATATSTWVSNSSNAGKLYLGTQNPAQTTRLNYNGYLYAKKLYSDGAEVKTTDNNYYATSNFTSSNGTKIATGYSSGTASTTYDLYVPNATVSQAGVITTGSQTFSGNKTFNGTATINGALIASLYDGLPLQLAGDGDNGPLISIRTDINDDSNTYYIGVEDAFAGSVWLTLPATSGTLALTKDVSSISWTNGTTSGPTGTLTAPDGTTTSSIPAIPSASSSQSGIITTGAQTIAGRKTFSTTPSFTGIYNSTKSGNVAAFDYDATNGSRISTPGHLIVWGDDDSNITSATKPVISGVSFSDLDTYYFNTGITLHDDDDDYVLSFPAKNGTFAIDSELVHKTGNETIAGTKTFEDAVNAISFSAHHADNNYGIDYSPSYILEYDYRQGSWKEAYFTLPNKGSGDYELATTDDIPTSFTLTDAILKGGANKYTAYPSGTANLAWVLNNINAGKLYAGTVNPFQTTRLNYNGYFYATKLYSGGSEVKTTDNDHYPTTFAWTNGTTSGPTGSLTGNSGFTAVSFGAIPAASGTQSGVITTGDQTFSGSKTFINTLKLGLPGTVEGSLQFWDAQSENNYMVDIDDDFFEVYKVGGNIGFAFDIYNKRLKARANSDSNYYTYELPSKSGDVLVASNTNTIWYDSNTEGDTTTSTELLNAKIDIEPSQITISGTEQKTVEVTGEDPVITTSSASYSYLIPKGVELGGNKFAIINSYRTGSKKNPIAHGGIREISTYSTTGNQRKLSIFDTIFNYEVNGNLYNITLPDASGTLALTSDLTGGTVTSVGLTMPTGFTVTNSPITTNGTLSVALASGYSLLNSNSIQYISGEKRFDNDVHLNGEVYIGNGKLRVQSDNYTTYDNTDWDTSFLPDRLEVSRYYETEEEGSTVEHEDEFTLRYPRLANGATRTLATVEDTQIIIEDLTSISVSNS